VLSQLGFLHSHSEIVWGMPMLIYRHSGLQPRRATLADLPAIAALHRRAFFEAMPHMPVLHTPQEDLAFYSQREFTNAKIWVCERAKAIVGFIAFRAGWIDHLYVHPAHQRQGIGSVLLSIAMATEPDLRLWTFQCNGPARQFYERHDFEVDRVTDGSGNDERQPDVLYHWWRRT
jgi:ribosomal protein S18 acetylase RimI-like enzyme